MTFREEWPVIQKNIRYSDDSELNTYQTCLPRPPIPHDDKRLWVIYIHGGAWRDPLQTASTFDTAQEILLQSPVIDHIAGFASINYRLSPAPQHSTDPSHPNDPARNARHPDHINDVLKAILQLQEQYGFEDRYILAGHSCGATLALQVAMKRYWGAHYESTFAHELNVIPPAAIVGVEGIYDLPAFVKWHAAEPFYRYFVEGAFGPKESDWAAASPTSSSLAESWPDGRLVVLAHSESDELVEMEQPDLMAKALESQGFASSGERVLNRMLLVGKHDSVWKEGGELVKAIQCAIQQLGLSS